MKLNTSAYSGCVKSGTPFFKASKPMNKRANPTKNSPSDLRFFINRSGVATAMRGKTISVVENSNPKSDIIQAVTVVPMFAPIMTAIAPDSLSSPAFTKLTTITVHADDD